MTDGPGPNLAELRRQLADLAESVESEQPWDDPLPHVLRTAAAAAAAASAADLDPRPRPGPFALVRGRVAKIGWPTFNPVPIVSIAAVVLVVALIGVLLHGGGDGSKKSSAASYGGTEAAAGGTRAESRPTGGSATPHAPSNSRTSGAAACSTLPASSKVALGAPAELVRGGVIRVRVTTSGGLRLTSPTILVRSGIAVLGRLVPTVITPAPSTAGSVGSFVVTGRLVRTFPSCGDQPGDPLPGPSGPLGAALPAGRYQLVVTGSTSSGRAASAPVAITIHR